MNEVLVVVVVLLMIATLYRRNVNARQRIFINQYQFNPAIKQKVKLKYPHLSDQQLSLVMRGLKDYFLLCRLAKKQQVSMPSQVVDIAWHEFILFTRNYQLFCRKGLGRFLHHTPSEAMKTKTLAQQGIKKAWRLACANEGINPAKPNKLPLLFAIDAELCIADGFYYSLNCKDKSSSLHGDQYCASHIGCSSGCAGDSGATTNSSSFFDGASSDASGCSGGCGGD